MVKSTADEDFSAVIAFKSCLVQELMIFELRYHHVNDLLSFSSKRSLWLSISP